MITEIVKKNLPGRKLLQFDSMTYTLVIRNQDMLDHTVSYTIHLEIEKYTNQGLKQQDIINKINELYQTNFASADGINSNIKFTAYSEFYKQDMDEIENILNTMLFNKKHNKDEQVLYCCNQCGHDATQFQEGVCMDCCKENQRRLDEHNEQFDRWQSLTDKQRDDEIQRQK